MALAIRLLGPPTLERDGGPVRLEGRKTWALLAYLLLESTPPTRRELVSRLWSEADDPLAAARWALSQVRKALAPSADVVERDARLVFEPRGEVTVDARALLDGSWDADRIEDLVRGPLLEGIELDEAPEFGRWLEVQRARIASASSEALRTAVGLLASSDPERAIALAERGLLTDPFDDGLHVLIVETHALRGDHARARAYAETVARRYREELGIDAPTALLRALERAAPPTTPQVPSALHVRALLNTALARSSGADWDGAQEIALRAAREAAAAGEGDLEARALSDAVNFQTLAMRGTPSEWRSMLRRAAILAKDDPSLRSDVERELGRIGVLEGRYGAAEASLRRALALSRASGDEREIALAELFLGVCATDRCAYDEAEAHLRAALATHRVPQVVLAWLARMLVRAGRTAEASEAATRSIAMARDESTVLQLSLAHLQVAEVALLDGDERAASEHFGIAYALATETNDADWVAMSLRGLALLDERAGRPERARATLRDALAQSRRTPAAYRWVEVAITAELAERGAAEAAQVERALRIARSAPMPDLAERLDRAGRGHTPGHTVAS